MKKRILLILIFGISFAPAVFANDQDLRKDPAVSKQIARLATVGQMTDERAAHFCPGGSLFDLDLAGSNVLGAEERKQGLGAIRAISANQ